MTPAHVAIAIDGSTVPQDTAMLLPATQEPGFGELLPVPASPIEKNIIINY